MSRAQKSLGIRVTYDVEADVLSVELGRPREALGATEVTPGHYVHLDSAGRLVAIEVLDASEHYGPKVLDGLPTPARWLTMSEASRKSGLAPTTLRTQIQAGRLRAVKRARDWVVAEHELWNYIDNRAPQGRRSVKERRPPGRSKAPAAA